MQDIINQFDAAGGKATFFVNGFNYDCIYDQANVLLSAYRKGYQIGSHTWAHDDITTLTSSQLTADANKLRTAFVKILGANPTYFRPPYGSYNAGNVATLGTFGFRKFVLWDIDSGDSIGSSIAQQQSQYNSASTGTSHIFLQHETHQSTVQQMVPFIINWAKSRGLKMVTVGQCLGDPQSNWYNSITTPETRNPTWTC